MLIIVGGNLDPNIRHLCDHARRQGRDQRTVVHGPGLDTSISWALESDELVVDGETIRPSAVFMRHDVFASLHEPDEERRRHESTRAEAWHCLFRGWCAAHDDVRVLNRAFINGHYNKPLQLHLARRSGLRIPRTVISNDRKLLDDFAAKGPGIAKPVAGGMLTRHLSDALAGFDDELSSLPVPAIAQEMLEAPEVRLFLVGKSIFPFRLASPHLDYRADPRGVEVRYVPPAERMVDGAVVAGLRTLAALLGLNFCAADFKTDSKTGDLVFLEVNEQPMFVRFDLEAGGRLCDAMLELLCR